MCDQANHHNCEILDDLHLTISDLEMTIADLKVEFVNDLKNIWGLIEGGGINANDLMDGIFKEIFKWEAK